MHALLVNDDGFRAPGLWALIDAFAAAGHRVTVCAPDAERSASGHSMTFRYPLHHEEHMVAGRMINTTDGTPVDCVRFGLFLCKDDPPDIVVSGINNGANLGVDTYPSGTVSAAREASMRGFQALAVSVGGRKPADFGIAAGYALRAAEKIVSSPMPSGVLVNLNVPDLPPGEIKGVKVTRLSPRAWDNGCQPYLDGAGRTHWFFDWSSDQARETPEDTDVGAVNAGYVSVTPIHWAASDEESRLHILSWEEELRGG